MKTTIFTIVAVLSITAAFAQKGKIPTAVMQSFKTNFPTAEKVKWEKESDHFEAEFTVKKSELSALFDAHGTLLETEIEIPVLKLPKAAIDYVESNYQNLKIKEASQITDAKGIVTYEAEVKGKDLIFDRDGKFLKAN